MADVGAPRVNAQTREQALAQRGRQWSHVSRDAVGHVYYSIHVQNTTPLPIPAVFNETRTDPLLKVPRDYYGSIIRFSVPGLLIPIFFFPNPNNNANGNLSVTLTFGGVPFETYLIYVPANNLPTTDPFYYAVFSYQQMIDMVNTAFQTSWLALKAAFPLAPPNSAPYLTFDSATRLFTLNAEVAYAGPATVSIFMSGSLYDYFASLRTVYNTNLSPASNNQTAQILIENTGNNTVTLGGPFPGQVGSGYGMVQETPTLWTWQEFRSLVFETSQIPIVPEQIPSSDSPGAVAFRPVWSDFEPDLSLGTEPQSLLQYQATVYRLTDMTGEVPLRNIDLRASWEDQTDTLRQILIPSGQIMTVKLMFRRKTFNGTPSEV